MKPGGVPVALFLLLVSSTVHQISSAEDLYWEGEEDASNEFLEVKEEEDIGGRIKRHVAGFFDFFSLPSSTTTTEAPEEEATDDPDVEDPKGYRDDLDHGSGLPDRTEPEHVEKTLRVTFVVMEPYQTEFSNRDSIQFQNFSRTLADAVNLLYDSLPGTQRASLVRIQSRVSDEFSCKVTIDIVTSGYDNTNRIANILHDHIRNRMKLGSVAVSDADDFGAYDIDPGLAGLATCEADEIRCGDETCVPASSRCDGNNDCYDGVDELNCPTEPSIPEYEDTTAASATTSVQEYDEAEETTYRTTETNSRSIDSFSTALPPTGCPPGYFSCDDTRCLPLSARCDGVKECTDGADEVNCETCGADDFRCNNGKCIEAARRCDRIDDCPNEEDEQNCDCGPDEFQCVSDRSCIEARKRCDGTNHCKDSSDEINCDWWGSHVCQDSGRYRCTDGTCISVLLRCDGFRDCPRDNSDETGCPCGPGQWQCDFGNCIKRSKRCDGRIDCPSDRSDERNCHAIDKFRCRSGKLIPENLRCNRRYDCPVGDYSDEQNCPCGDSDFQCDNGNCIPASKRCDRTHDCQDRSDERDCTYGTVCMAFQYKCSSGQCVPAESFCNGTIECDDWSDEQNCSCKREEFRCRDGTCLNFAQRCNGYRDCHPNGEDEINCGYCPSGYWQCDDNNCIPQSKRCDRRYDCRDFSDEKTCGTPNPLSKEERVCPADSFTCDIGSRVVCATRCDNRPECDNAEDEQDCDACSHLCNGMCLDDSKICNGEADCADGSDEQNCFHCDGPEDFRCRSGECINIALKCNDIPDCADDSDEANCNKTMISRPEGCSSEEFQCLDGTCLNNNFRCDKWKDCTDGSDELNCQCDDDQFRCTSGQCIDFSMNCDGLYDCADKSDEIGCPTPWSSQPNEIDTTTTTSTTTTTTRAPPAWGPQGLDGCQRNQWRCENGPCIESYRRCDGRIDCPFDSSDEFDCPPGSPVALNLKTYPREQAVRFRGDVVFQCRDEGPMRVAVRWVREGGRPLKPNYTLERGRLEINRVTTADEGTYICQAADYLGYPGAEVRVRLHVDPAPVTAMPPSMACQPNEATCGNGQCIPKSAVCNGVVDCSDRSDEDTCHMDGKCEPNQFKCRNNKCVLKTWLCDSEDDCGDGSDESDCGYSAPGKCRNVEFTCASGQCVPKSFHCDGRTDCQDGSDEIGCAPVYVTSPPKPSNVILDIGSTLTLNCSATGTPMPVISWRRNWGDVPDVCTVENINRNGQVVGILTCPNMMPEYNGAYSCEAMNNKGTIFAIPDAIVFVNMTDICPRGYFNSEARNQGECIRCFCFGESTRCHSADLFTYNMPTPLGEGGTRLVGVKNAANGEAQLDTQPINDQYYYQPLRNGAMVTKLEFSSGWGRSSALPYVTLPETYNGNQLTSYGGYIRYRLSPHFSSYGPDNSAPHIIIKGKYQNLVHFNRGGKSQIEARLTPESWQKPSSGGLVPATREDIMMALDNVEVILLRAGVNNAGVNITGFVMESAQLINVGLGAASLVEECVCPSGYEGLSCQKCASGYVRERAGQWLGHCVPERPSCAPGTYGDPNSGYACRPCPCPLTNRENQFAGTCRLASDGNVDCDCYPGYEGRNCEYCAEGYIGNPMVAGDSCQLRPVERCNPVGTSHMRLPDECECRENVQGRYCDQCKNGTYFLSSDFRHGCALCFCSGVTQQCMSSNLRRQTTSLRFNTPSIVNQLGVYDSTPLGGKYNAPVRTTLVPALNRGAVTLPSMDASKPAIYYWSLPAIFAGDKVTAYGGHLRYVLQNVPGSFSSRNTAADVQLISVNRLTFHYFGNFVPSSDGTLQAEIQFLEKGWQRPDGKEVLREHFLLALADVEAILIKASYGSDSQLASIESASIDTAEPNGDGPAAMHVEQCVCPREYVGTSCEDCAPGYTRYGNGLYLEHCGPCECGGNSNMCDPESGDCIDCQNNTDGVNCELCKPGFRRDSNNNCVAEYSPRPPQTLCDPRGSVDSYPTNGYCNCKQNVDGQRCDTCRPGTFGLDSENAYGCHTCYCSGVTSDCHEAPSQLVRIPMAAPMFGSDYGGYKLMDLNAESVLNDHIVSMPVDSELMYVFNFPPTQELFWSLPVFPGNRVQSYGGTLQLKQKFESRDNQISEPGTDIVLVGSDMSIYWTNPQRITAGVPLSYQVTLKENGWYILNSATPVSRRDFMSVLSSLSRVLVRATLVRNIESTSIADVAMDTVTEQYGAPTSARATGVEVCICPDGYSGTSCERCSSGYYRDIYGTCQLCDCGGYDCYLSPDGNPVCTNKVVDPNRVPTTTTALPPPARPTVVVQITPSMIRIQKVGDSVNFTCQAQSRMSRGRLPVTWSKVGGYLPQGRHIIDDSVGMLIITNVQVSDSGKYICQTSDGVFSAQDYAQLVLPVNDMTQPTVEIQPAVNDYFEDERIELICRATGNPSPTVSWQRSSGRPLPSSARNIDERLIIENARQEDSGEYRCIASNTLGYGVRTAVVNIRPRPAEPPRDRLTVSKEAPSVAEGQSIRVTCTGSANVPAGTIDWVRQDGTELQSNVRSVNGVLYIDYATLDNEGVYICQTSSYDVDPVLIALSVVPQGTPSPSEISNITVSVDSLRLPSGTSGTVECLPRGYPVPLIRWSKHDGQFGPGTSQRQNTLVISNAREDDQGYYLCQGIVDGRTIANIYVYVDIERREKPEIEIWPQGEQSVTLGSSFELRCRVRAGVPEPSVTWSRNSGRSLSSHTQLLPNNILRFERVEVNDEGEYSCSASNVEGVASASATIKVRSTPEISIMPSDFIQKVEGDSVTVECRARGYPLPTVSIMTVDQREVVPPTPGMAVLQIDSLADRDDGEYTCSARSAGGNVTAQFLIRVDRGDGGFGDVEGSGDVDFNTDYPSNPDLQPRDIYATEGETANIGCKVSGNRNVRWSRGDGMPLQANIDQVDSELIIRNPSKSDNGQYICNVYNAETGAVEHSHYISVVVLAPPRITLQPPTQTVQTGESPTVECIVEGDEILEITWKPLSRPFSRRIDIRDNKLIFNRIEVEDAGLYECFTKNRIKSAKATAEVVVSEESRPPVESHDNEQCAHVGAAVQLSCAVPTASRVRWTKDGAPLPRSVVQWRNGSLYIRHAQKTDTGRYVCDIQDNYGRRTSNYINLQIDGPSDEPRPPALVAIDQPRRQYRVGENLEVLCRAKSRGLRVSWERYATKQYVESRTYGDGAMLIIPSVQESDAGLYRCTGNDPYGRTSYEDFNLEVKPGGVVAWPEYQPNNIVTYTARLGYNIDVPCTHNLEQPVSIEWRREYAQLQPDVRASEPILRLENVTESDAGTYICRASNSRTALETRAILKVLGVVPSFEGHSWISLPTLKDAYKQFEMEVSFKPLDGNGLILYNSQYPDGRSGDYVALRLVSGVPEFIHDVGSGPIYVRGDRPLALNTWHTIRISKTNSKVTMDVDNNGPESVTLTGWELLEVSEPLYIGGVPDNVQLPEPLEGSSGFIGCVSMLILGREEKNIILDSIERVRLQQCDSCSPNLCNKNGVCQEARNERGYTCLCTAGFAGLNCDRTGEACRPGLCGPGKCTDTADGYKCACPVSYTGKNCDVKQSIEYPAFTGSAYLAINPPKRSRFFRMAMKVKAASPVTDGVIMYCAESSRGYGGFTALTVHNGRLEFTYDLGDGTKPVVLTSNRTLPANEWTGIYIVRVGQMVTMEINSIYTFEKKLESAKNDLNLDTPMFVGGVDDSIQLNKNTGVTGGFSGCIKDVVVYGTNVDIVGSSIQSANVQECRNYDRGDIPEIESENVCYLCRNGAACSSDGTSCICPPGFSGQYCENYVPLTSRRPAGDPCTASPCRNGGTCRRDLSTRMNYTCDCPLGFAGANCQMPLELLTSVGFNGNGYIELPAEQLRYDNLEREPAIIALAFYTNNDGVLLYQKEALAAPNFGDYLLIKVENGIVVMEWDLGGGLSTLSIDDVFVVDGDRHSVIAKLNADYYVSLTVDGTSKNGTTNGFSDVMNADSNIYVGGIPDSLNVHRYPGLNGCVEQIELMNADRGINLGRVAVTGRNTQRCRK